ncbi:DUF1810 domain-containing protein [Nocardioides sp. zg-1230]|uniref:DUF1810 domain-containing protein n=1 Tax=Nocardioides sp. zg-1230 TaxID=2736601 RepID=UPI0015570471|nr:DUF1810 domain-containing protein [Nocardioides sp. zg-1230]NPC41591.1 DUF1810 domain-containing protein [Nocardioides sp. zg-1230]
MDLQRFVDAQDDHGTYDQALSELRAGRKTSHWMWFVLPQVSGLGQSPTAKHFGIAGLGEARAYLDHEVLGPRLLECCRALLALDGGTTAEEVLGSVDAMKLRSSMTLFARADPDERLFPDVLDRFFDGTADERTIRLLG